MSEIRLSIPAKAENILAIRLFASGLAMRQGFDINKIEDIKTAISESCVLLLSGSDGGDFLIGFDTEDCFDIVLNKVGTVQKEQQDDEFIPELSKMLLEGLTEELKITEVDGDCIAIKLSF